MPSSAAIARLLDGAVDREVVDRRAATGSACAAPRRPPRTSGRSGGRPTARSRARGRAAGRCGGAAGVWSPGTHGAESRRTAAARSAPATPYASASASRCSSGTSSSPPLIAPSSARSAGLNGNRAGDDVDRVVERRARRCPTGRAPGRRSAAPAGSPAAWPRGPRAPGRRSPRPSPRSRARRPPARPARPASRLQSSPTKAASPNSISSVTASAQSALSTTFSASSAVRETSPRTSRPNACSSRSSASRPAASSSVTNISETVTATATAKESSGVRSPSTIVCLTRTGEPIEARIGCETSRFSAASRAKRDTCSSAARSGEPSGSCSATLSMICREPLEAEDLDGAHERQRDLAAVDDHVDVAGRLAQHDLGQRRVGLGQPRLDRRLDEAPLHRVLGVVPLPCERSQAEDLDRAHERQRDLAAAHDHVDVARRLAQHGVRQRVVGLGQPRLDRRLDEAALHRVLGVVVDLDGGRLAAAEPERRPQPLGRVRRDHERAERLAVADLLDRLLARVDRGSGRSTRTAGRRSRRRRACGRRPGTCFSPGGTRLANATRGLSGPPDSASPNSTAMTIG